MPTAGNERELNISPHWLITFFPVGIWKSPLSPFKAQFESHFCITWSSLAPWPSNSVLYSSCEIIIAVLKLKGQHGFCLVVHRTVFSIRLYVSQSQVQETKHFPLYMLETCLWMFHVSLSPFYTAQMLCQKEETQRILKAFKIYCPGMRFF